MKRIIFFLCCVYLFLVGFISKADNVSPVKNFEIQRYVGKWYEIARYDSFFEKGLSNVTAEYSLNQHGSVKVVNSGVKQNGQSTSVEGKAEFVDKTDEGFLQVSFFGPFYSAYIVFAIEDDYKYAFIAGNNYDYLWLLSRTPTVPKSVKDDFVKKSKSLGFDVDKLVWVKQ